MTRLPCAHRKRKQPKRGREREGETTREKKMEKRAFFMNEAKTKNVIVVVAFLSFLEL